jgi:DNA-binding transcriptional LysR family regulator
VEVYSDDALIDIVERGFDAGIRLGEAVQRDMIAVRLTRPFKSVLVASREYLELKGTPKTIGDLHRHNCIGLRLTGSGGIFEWEMDGKKITTIKTSGTALVTDSTQALGLASAGVGIAYAIEPLGRPPHPRGPSQMAAAAMRRRVRRIVPLLPAAGIAGAQVARLHRGCESRTQAIVAQQRLTLRTRQTHMTHGSQFRCGRLDCSRIPSDPSLALGSRSLL